MSEEQIPGAMPVQMGNMKIKEHVSDDEPLCFQKSQDTMLDAIKSHHRLPLDNSEVLVQQEVRDVVGCLHPVHFCDIGGLREVLKSGSLQPARLSDLRLSAFQDADQMLSKQIRSDMRIKALVLRFLKTTATWPSIMRWTIALAEHHLHRLLGLSCREDRKRVAAARAEMMQQNGWVGASFQLAENRVAVGSSVGAGAAVAAASVAAVFAPLVLPTALLVASAGGALAGGAAVLLFDRVSELALRGGSALALTQPDWGNVDAMQLVLQMLQKRRLSRHNDADQELSGHAVVEHHDKHLCTLLMEARTVKHLIALLEQYAERHAVNVFDTCNRSGNLGARFLQGEQTIGYNRCLFAPQGLDLRTHDWDVYLVLNQEIMHHPDFDITLRARRPFSSNSTSLSFEEDGTACAMDEFHTSGLNAGTHGWRGAMAAALAHLVHMTDPCAPRLGSVTKEEIMKLFSIGRSSCVVEFRLLGVVPLRQNAHSLVIRGEAFKKLDSAEQLALADMVGNRLEIVPDKDSSRILTRRISGARDEHLGFCFRVSGEVDRFVVLRGVQPSDPQVACFEMKLRGASELYLGPAPIAGAKEGITMAFSCTVCGAMDSCTDRAGADAHHRDTSEPTPTARAANDLAASSRVVCSISSIKLLSSSAQYELDLDENGWLHCRVVITTTEMQFSDRLGSTSCTPPLALPLRQPLNMEVVAARPCLGNEDVEIFDLRVLRASPAPRN